MIVFETMQEEEIKILSTLLLITNSWLQAFALCKPLDGSWVRGGEGRGHRSWGMSLLCSPLFWLRIKVTFLFPPYSVSVFFDSALVGREGQDFGQQ